MKKTLELDFTNKASNVSISEEIVTKIWGEGLGWSQSEAEAVLLDHTQYVENLQSVGIQTSEILSKEVYVTEDESFVIRETEKFSGRDASIALLSAHDKNELESLVQSDFQATASLLLSIPPRDGEPYSSENPCFKVPVDMKPQNVVITNDSDTVLVIDTFGPKLWLQDKIKPLPSKIPGQGQILHDDIKVGDVRFALGRLNGYFIALTTRWVINNDPSSTIDQIDEQRFKIAAITGRIIHDIVTNNPLFDQTYAASLIADASEAALQSIKIGSYEGPMYVQLLYEMEEAYSIG